VYTLIYLTPFKRDLRLQFEKSSLFMALSSPPAWPPNVSLDRIRFIIDVSEPDTASLLVELFTQHTTVHSFSCMKSEHFDSITFHARTQPTIVIVDGHCRSSMGPSLFSEVSASASSGSHWQSRASESSSFHSHADMVRRLPGHNLISGILNVNRFCFRFSIPTSVLVIYSDFFVQL
jgi:hypothetical protein